MRASKVGALPDWACWFIELGRWMSRAGSQDGLVRVALSVPHRSYAAAFVATGVVLNGCATRAKRSAREHFAYLESIPAETPVRYREASTNVVSFGRIHKVRTVLADDGVACLSRSRVYLSGGYSRVAKQCTFIEALPDDSVPPVRGRDICKNPSFVKTAARIITLTPEFDVYEHAFRQRVECTIVGTKSTLENELDLRLQAEAHTGTIQDLVRVDERLHPSDGYRCRIVSAYGDPEGDDFLAEPEATVILDSSSAVLRWRDAAQEHHWLAIIDRTTPSADLAREAIIADRATSIEDLAPSIGEIPSGVELLCYMT